MKYAIFAIPLLVVSYPIYAFFNPSLETLIERQNALIDQANNEKLESYRANLLECIDTATGKVLQEFDDCTRTPKPTLQERVWTLNASGGIAPVPLWYAITADVKQKEKVEPVKNVINNSWTIVWENDSIRLTICKKVPDSPLCNSENFQMAKAISYKKALIWWVKDKDYFFKVGIGIMNAESTVGTKYAWTCDKSYNNFWGIKWRILDTGEAIKDQKIGEDGCWLYKFNSLEDYFGSKYNSLGKGYGSCFNSTNPIYCISWPYVGDRYVHEVSWQNNVKSLIQ